MYVYFLVLHPFLLRSVLNCKSVTDISTAILTSKYEQDMDCHRIKLMTTASDQVIFTLSGKKK